MNTKQVNQDFYSMKTNFTRIADHFYKQVTVNDVLKEAVMNSIQANATNISVYFQYEYTKTLDGHTSNLGNLSKIIIEDNGDGLTQKNIDAFLEVATNHKENIGGKGIGRISFLKIASSIQVESISIEKKHIDFDFTYNTDENSIKARDCANQNAYTKITLNNLNLKHPKTQAASCANFLKEKFNLMLFLKQKETQKEISINFFVNNKLVELIKSSNIHCLKTIDYSNNDCKFSIYAFHNNEKQGIQIYYCANNLQVTPITISENFHTQYIFAVTSDFFDARANNERTGFNFQPFDEEFTQKDLLSGTPKNNFEKEIKQLCLNVVHENEPNIAENNKAKLEKLKKKYGYINFDDIDPDSLDFDEEEIVSAYRKKRDTEEDKLAILLDKPDLSAEELVNKVADQNKHELAKYIFHRDLIAKKGLSLTDSKENEDVLHNLFFPQRASVNIDKELEHNKKDLYQNCIWLLDDKFMSYVYTASDITMKKINSEIGCDKSICTSEKRPDLFILYNNPEDSESLKDAVMIEFKKGNIDYKEKMSAIDQVDEYKEMLKKIVDNINSFYCYIICDFNPNDTDIERAMINRGFTKVFSNNGCMYYGYLRGSETHVTFVSSNSIFADAVARNKTFLDILTSNS